MSQPGIGEQSFAGAYRRLVWGVKTPKKDEDIMQHRHFADINGKPDFRSQFVYEIAGNPGACRVMAASRVSRVRTASRWGVERKKSSKSVPITSRSLTAKVLLTSGRGGVIGGGEAGLGSVYWCLRFNLTRP